MAYVDAIEYVHIISGQVDFSYGYIIHFDLVQHNAIKEHAQPANDVSKKTQTMLTCPN